MSIVSLEREQSITEIEAQIRQGTEIPFLQTRVDMPPLPRRRLLILHTFLEHLGWPLQRRQAACAAAGKAQWGLDIHEQISSGALDRYGEVKRQLSVLAGDLFSSQYYANLSQRGETQMIQQIARGISEVNEAKMEWYQMALRKSCVTFSRRDTFVCCLKVNVEFLIAYSFTYSHLNIIFPSAFCQQFGFV